MIRRSRLVQFLEAHIQRQLVLVTAPAGYGKTTLLVDFAWNHQWPIAWYSVDADDSDSRSFLSGLVHTIQHLYPGSLSFVAYQIRESWSPPEPWKAPLAALISELAQNSNRFVLILDDAQHLTEEGLAIIDYLLEHQPPNLSVILSSRTRLSLKSVPRLKASRNASALETTDLALTTEELHTLLSTLSGASIDRDELERLAMMTQGWAAAAVLLTSHQWEEGMTRSTESQRSMEELFEYLATELLARCNQSVRQFFLAISVLDDFTPSLCDALLERDDSARVCRDLEREHGLIRLIADEDKERTYRMHDLLRAFLRDTLKNEQPGEYRRLQLRAGDLLLRSRPDRAIEYYLTLGALAQAVECLLEVAEGLIQRGEARTLLRLCERLPEEEIAREPYLLFWRAEALRWTGEAWEAIRSADEAARGFGRQEDTIGLARSLLVKGAALRHLGQYSEAIVEIQEALQLARSAGSSRVIASSLHQLGISHHTAGKLNESLPILEEALSACEEHDRYRRGLILWDLGTVHLRLGKLDHAIARLERARQCLQSEGHSLGLAGILNNLGAIYRLRGAYSIAKERLERALELAEAAGDHRSQASCLKTLADVALDEGDVSRSEALYRRALTYAERISRASTISEALAGLSETLVLAGDAKQAEVLLQQALVDVRGKVPYAEGLYRNALGMALADRGQEDESIHNLEEACELLEGYGAVRYAAVARFRLGQRLFSRRRYADSLIELAQAGLHAATVGCASFLVPEARRFPLLIEYAASRQPTKAFYTQLKRELRADIAEGTKAFEESNTSQSSELATITAYALGTDLVRLNDREVSASEWQTNKSREMFFYLLLKPGWQHREAILVDLWPEVGAEQGNRMFHITLHRLRQALYPGCVVQQGRMYRLNPLARYSADVIEFQELVENRNQSNTADGDNLKILEKALDIYRGPFLPDCYSEWSEDIRRQLETTYLHTLRNVATFHTQQGVLEKALPYWERLTTESPYEEDPNLQLVNTLISLQRPIEAERHFQRYMDLLRTEGLKLSPIGMRQHEAFVQGVPAA